MLAAMLHNADPTLTESTLDRLGVFKLHGYPVRKRVIQSVSTWPKLTVKASDTQLRHLSETHDISLVSATAWAVTGDQTALANLERAVALGISSELLPVLIKGRDLRKFGIDPGPTMGEWLQKIRIEQLEGRVTTTDEAALWLKEQLS